MKPTKLNCLAAGIALFAAAVTEAAIIRVEMQGNVEWNQFIDGPFHGVVLPGDPVVMVFDLDAGNFVTPPLLPPPDTCHTLGFPIIGGSFSLRVGSVDVPLTDPTNVNPVVYWVLRDNDPGADGVVLATDPCGNFSGAPIDLAGASGAPFSLAAKRTFDDGNQPNTVFNSLDIQEAVGYWAWEWMSVYDFTINGGGGTPMGVTYDWFSMTELSAPVITSQPDSANACPGGTVQFTLAATNAESYSWRHNGNPLVDGFDAYGGLVSGANSPTVTIEYVTPDHIGFYDCRVSNGPIADFPYDVAFSAGAQLQFWNSCSAGDMDCDQLVTYSDVAGFVQAVLNPGEFGGCNLSNADINLDGLINGEDVEPFVGLLLP